MTVLRLALLILVAAFTTVGQQNSSQQGPVAPASCPVTVLPVVPFTPPAPYKLDSDRSFWLGTEKLFTALPKSGVVWGWGPRAPGHEQNLTAKTFWGSVNFDYKKENPPELRVTGKRLDGDAPPLWTARATNAFPGPSAAMLVGVYVPTPGCWEITGHYKGQKLSYVVWVKQGYVN